MTWAEDPKIHGWRSGQYRIELIWFTVRESYDVYFDSEQLGGFNTLEEAKMCAETHHLGG